MIVFAKDYKSNIEAITQGQRQLQKTCRFTSAIPAKPIHRARRPAIPRSIFWFR